MERPKTQLWGKGGLEKGGLEKGGLEKGGLEKGGLEKGHRRVRAGDKRRRQLPPNQQPVQLEAQCLQHQFFGDVAAEHQAGLFDFGGGVEQWGYPAAG